MLIMRLYSNPMSTHIEEGIPFEVQWQVAATLNELQKLGEFVGADCGQVANAVREKKQLNATIIVLIIMKILVDFLLS